MNGKTVVPLSASQRNSLYGFLDAVFVIAFARGVPGASTTTGQVVVAVFTGGLVIGVSALWIQSVRIGGWIEVSADSIVQCTKRGVRSTLLRSDGDVLRFEMRGVNHRYRHLALVQTATNTAMGLQFYKRKMLETACREHGWQFE